MLLSGGRICVGFGGLYVVSVFILYIKSAIDTTPFWSLFYGVCLVFWVDPFISTWCVSRNVPYLEIE